MELATSLTGEHIPDTRLMSRITIVAIMCIAVPFTGCVLRRASASKTAPPTPAPQAPAAPAYDAAQDGPYSVPQTNVRLPSPQPISPEAIASLKDPGQPQTAAPAKPAQGASQAHVNAPVHTAAPPPIAAPATEQQQPPPAAAPPRQTIRPVESTRERRRQLTDIQGRLRNVEDSISRVERRELSDDEKNSLARVRSFLEQARQALSRKDLQQADALASRALIIVRDLSSAP